MRKSLFAFAAVVMFPGLFIACNKQDSGNGTTDLRVNLTDAPYDAQEINVDIQQVKVNFDNDTLGWVSLPVNAGIYNLLAFQGGVDTLLANGPVPTGRLNQLRFVLGSNNSIMIDSVVYPLRVPSGAESGLKIKVNRQLASSMDSLTIDFDAGLSIHQNGLNDYILRPVLVVR